MTRRTLRAAALVLAIGIVVSSGEAPAAGPTLSADAFLARIDGARAVALDGVSGPSTDAMRRVRDALGLPVTVQVSGTRLHIEDDPFLLSLRGSISADFERAVAHLDGLAAAVRETEDTAPGDRGAIDDAVRGALVGVARPTAISAIRAYVYAAIRKILSIVFEPLREFRGVRSIVAWVVVAAILIGIVLLLRRQGLGLVPDRSVDRDRGARDVDWDRIAEEALRRGDLREATRALYHALLRRLAFRGIVPAGTSTTAGECRAAVAARLPSAYDAVSRGTNAFERVAYGGAAASSDDIEALRDAARRVAA